MSRCLYPGIRWPASFRTAASVVIDSREMTSPPKHQSDSNKLVNRLGLATLSLRPRWRVMVLGHQSVGKSGTLHLNIYPVIINGIDATTQCLNLDRPDPLKSIHERDRTTRLVQYSFALLGTFKMNKG